MKEEEPVFASVTTRAAIRLVATLGDAATDSERRERLMEGLCDILKADCWAWVFWDRTDGVDKGQFEPQQMRGLDDEQLRLLLRDWDVRPLPGNGDVLPLERAEEASRDSRWPESAEICSPDRFLEEIGLGSYLRWGGEIGESRTCAVLVVRSAGSERFSSADGYLMDAVIDGGWRAHTRSRAIPPGNGGGSLSPRQQSVLALLLKGLSRRGIAGELELSHHTVGDHIKEIYRAFNVHSQAELLGRFVGETGESGVRTSE